MSYGGGVSKNSLDAELGLRPVLRKTRLSGAERKPVVGSWIMMPGASLARMVASVPGIDFCLVDCEHGDMSDSAMHTTVHAVAAAGCSPIVRVAAPENYLIKRALDTGAHAIMVPMCNNAEEARRIVSYSKFPVPKAILDKARASGQEVPVSGVRGIGSPFSPAVFGQNLPDYVATANRNTMVFVQIETVDGLNNCEEIAKSGVDCLFVGPNDLSSQMGYVAGDHAQIPEVQEACARILKAAKDAGIYAGIFCTSGEQVKARFEQGFDVMNVGGDWLALTAWHETELAKISA